MNFKQLKIILGIMAILLLLGLGYTVSRDKPPTEVFDQQNTQSPTASGLPMSTNKVDTSSWKTYANMKHGFELKYPAGSTVEPASQSDSAEYIRIQNYSINEDGIELKTGEYYLEIFISNSERACEEELEQARKISIDGSAGYRGLGLPGGDPGGKRLALCVNKNGKHFYIQATENSDIGNIANAILDSFRFINQ